MPALIDLSPMLLADVARAISESLDTPVTLRRAEDAPGGCISRAFIAQSETARYFVKTDGAHAIDMLCAEVDGLQALRDVGALRVPQVVACGVSDKRSFLVLEHLDLIPLTEGSAAIRFARALAATHRASHEHFGWQRDNFIGRSPQLNSPHAAWPYFFARRRLAPQIELAARRGADRRLISEGEKLIDSCAALFVDHRPAPSLLHGDLWHGNAAMLRDGTPVAFDPAVYHGDREADLAMAELFGGFPTSFYAAYRQAWPLPEGYERRKTLYNLYHILNHFNLFGSGYQRQASRMIAALLAELRG